VLPHPRGAVLSSLLYRALISTGLFLMTLLAGMQIARAGR